MKRAPSLLLSFLLSVAIYSSLSLPLAAEVTREYVSDARTPAAPGVQHDQGTIVTDTAGIQAVHLLEIDLDEPVINIEGSISNDTVANLETTSSQANRQSAEGHRAAGAINGDFWASASQAPSGLHIQEGELVAAFSSARPTFGMKANGDPIIGDPAVAGNVTAPPIVLTRGGSLSHAIARINQERAAGQLIVYTPRFATSTRTDNTGSEAVLTGVALPIGPSGTYRGTVSQVRPDAGSTPIGAGEVVLSGKGSAANFVKALAPGDEVEFTISISDGWQDVTEAVGGGQHIVRNGVVVPAPSDGFSDVTHPRTALGITAGGDVIMATVDGRQPGYSIGVRLDELGELMRSRGAMTAINMDGGGSTTMVVRQPGDGNVSVVNRGSDGFERSVSNSLLVFSSAPTGPLAIVNVFPSDVSVLAGSHINYTVKGQDAAYNPVPVAPGSVSWSVAGGAGTIDTMGRFTATAAGTGTVIATVGDVSGSTSVTVVNALASVEVLPNPAVIEPGATQAFTVVGRDSSGAEVRVDSEQATWSVSGPIGTIDSSGVLTASATPGSGSVIATAGGVTGSARVDVGRAPVILEDFEDISDMRATAAQATATLTSAMRPNPVRVGTRSGRLGYSFTGTATSAAYAAHFPTLPVIDGLPLRIGVWFYGDGSRHWVRGNYRDGNNAQKTLNFTAQAAPATAPASECGRRSGGIDWVGWKYIEAPIPSDAVLPLKWERIYVVETNSNCDNTSAIYLDDLRAVYSNTGEDLVGPAVTELTPAPNSTVFESTPTIGGTVRDNTGGSGVAPDSIRLLVDNAQVSAGYDPATGEVRYTPPAPLPDGTHTVRLEASDNAGNPALPFGEWSFTIYTGPDRDAPVIDRAVPLDGTQSPAGRPRISARVRDPHRGVDAGSIALTVDGALVQATWDAQAGVVWWAPPTALTDGQHTISLSVSDRESPANTATAGWSFSVAAIPQPPANVPFQLTWMADGGYYEGTRVNASTQILEEHLSREATAPPDLLVFGGDLVENDQPGNYDRAVAALNTVPSPRLVAAGNHEISGSLSRDRFWRTFGPTIEAVDYGPVDLLVVDTASSSFAYDTSQFAWIESELARSDARTVFVVLHVPTVDPFGSGHGLPTGEGQRLEAIFAAAKAARPERDIVVLSGDAHAYGGWIEDGVTYIISGGAGGGPDATPANGGFYHRLHIQVDPAGVARFDVVPLFEAIIVSPAAADLFQGEMLNLTAIGDVFTASAPDMSLGIGGPLARVWRSSDPAVVLVDPQTGVAEALNPGEATVTVESGDRIGSTQIRVTPGPSIVSRKIHGPAGAKAFDIDLPLAGTPPGIECRRNTGADTSGPNAGRNHELLLTFPTAVTVGGASVTSNDAADAPTATFSVSGNAVTVYLHNIPNAPRRLIINLTEVSDGASTRTVSIPMGVLAGDTNDDTRVNVGDTNQTKSRSGQTLGSTNFRSDVNLDGRVNIGDTNFVKSRSGTGLPQ